ncbi:hypothetical protein T484DRAFT_1933618 [Baffinella frigidus]|nr:hypothetical protein T484DRAFT_1933618 [Cryptophyta sp. CCMP2293]
MAPMAMAPRTAGGRVDAEAGAKSSAGAKSNAGAKSTADANSHAAGTSRAAGGWSHSTAVNWSHSIGAAAEAKAMEGVDYRSEHANGSKGSERTNGSKPAGALARGLEPFTRGGPLGSPRAAGAQAEGDEECVICFEGEKTHAVIHSCPVCSVEARFAVKIFR